MAMIRFNPKLLVGQLVVCKGDDDKWYPAVVLDVQVMIHLNAFTTDYIYLKLKSNRRKMIMLQTNDRIDAFIQPHLRMDFAEDGNELIDIDAMESAPIDIAGFWD